MKLKSQEHLNNSLPLSKETIEKLDRLKERILLRDTQAKRSGFPKVYKS